MDTGIIGYMIKQRDAHFSVIIGVHRTCTHVNELPYSKS